MTKQIKKILSSKALWIILGLGVLFWGLQEYTFWKFDIVFLVFYGPYIFPLIIPMIFFYLFVQKKNKTYFQTTVDFLILWPIWSLFWLEIWAKGFGGSIDVFSFVIVICPILILSGISIAYVYHCNNILNKGKNTLFQRKKKMLWVSWFMGLAVIILGSWLWSYIGTRLSNKLPMDLMGYMFGLICFSLMWFIFTLPATLKIDNILSRED